MVKILKGEASKLYSQLLWLRKNVKVDLDKKYSRLVQVIEHNGIRYAIMTDSIALSSIMLSDADLDIIGVGAYWFHRTGSEIILEPTDERCPNVIPILFGDFKEVDILPHLELRDNTIGKDLIRLIKAGLYIDYHYIDNIEVKGRGLFLWDIFKNDNCIKISCKGYVLIICRLRCE